MEGVKEYLCSGRMLEDGKIVYDYLLITLLGIGMLGTGLTYLLIPGGIDRIIAERDDIKGNIKKLMKLFIIFILSCGMGHIIDFANIFLHYYYVAAYWHIQTFVISTATVFYIARHLKHFINYPSRKKMLEYQQASELVNKATKSGIWFFNFKKGKITWTESMYDIYDKPYDWEIDNDELTKMVDDDYIEAYHEIAELHAAGEDFTEPFLYKVNTGKSIKYLEAKTVLRKKENGETIGMFGSVQDVTKRILKEQEKEILINSLKIQLAKVESSESILKAIEKLVA